MKKIIIIVLVLSHLAVGGIGFAAGIYILPILIAPPAPSVEEIAQVAERAIYSTEFSKDRQDSDALHWGEGQVSISDQHITLMGRLSPGPDYKLYLSPSFVETEAAFEQLKPSMVRVGDVNTFENFMIDIPPSIDISQFNTIVIWCERFGEFITSGQYD